MKNFLFLFAFNVFPYLIYSQKNDAVIMIEYSVENPETWILVYAVDGSMGYLNSKGEEIVPAIYEEIYPFGEYIDNWAKVRIETGLYGFINTNGKVIVEPKYDDIGKFGEYKPDWALVSIYEKYGFINTKGEEVVAPKYSEIPILKKD